MKIKLLEEYEIERIIESTEYILENTGFRIASKELLKVFADAGAITDDNSKIVKIPRKMLQDLLSCVPRSFEIEWMDGQRKIIGGDKQQITAIVTDPYILDANNQRPQPPSITDVIKNTIIAQKTDDVSSICLMDHPVSDFSGLESNLRALEAHLLNHTKHSVVDAASFEYLQIWHELADIILDGKELDKHPILTMMVSIVSPLSLEQINIEMLMFAIKNKLPIHPAPCPMAGATSPYSMIGSLLQANCEAIFLAALTQLLNPGHPYNYTIAPSVTDMRTGHDLYYSMDKILWRIAGCELAKAYGMPATSEYGGSLTYRYDMQSGAETMLSILASTNAEASILSGLGSTFNATGMSSEMMVIQSAWLEAAKYLSKGICTDYLDEGLRSITMQGPGGSFWNEYMSLGKLRSNDFFTSELFDSAGSYPGSGSILQKAQEISNSIIKDYVSPVPEKTKYVLRSYFERMYNVHNRYQDMKHKNLALQ